MDLGSINTHGEGFKIEPSFTGNCEGYFINLINTKDFYFKDHVKEEDIQEVVDSLVEEYRKS